MTDELKPVRCGCGGATRRCADPITGQWFVQCRACGTVALYYNSEAEAIMAWNRAMGATAEPERKWIPVSEALPEEDGKLTGYLVSIGYDVTIMCFVDGKFVSWTFADNKLVEKQFPVSAWMPLPEPYRGEE